MIRFKITYDRLKAINFGNESINGVSRIVPALGEGDPVEVFVEADDEPGRWVVSLLQSNRNDHVTITGRRFEYMDEINKVLYLLCGV